MGDIKSLIKNYGRPMLFFIALVSFILVGVNNQRDRTNEESIRVLEDSLYRATVQCYSIESQYPPDIEYLETNYGVNIDWNRYQVFYQAIGSNIMPDITVISLE